MPLFRPTSFTGRLWITLVATALLSCVGVLGLYFSGKNFLGGLREVNFANKVLSITTLALENITASDQALEKLLKTNDPAVVGFTFNETQKAINRQIHEALELSQNYPEVKQMLESSLASLAIQKQMVQHLLQQLKRLPPIRSLSKEEELKSQLTASQQYAIDAKEILRRVQIKLENQSSQLFSSVYKRRYTPLIVAACLSTIFLAFVLVSGFSNIHRLTRSLTGLHSATEAVAHGDLSYRAPIIENDEFGILTERFNHMVESLNDKQMRLRHTMNRITQLQTITASFSEALSADQVYQVIFQQAFEKMGAISGLVATMDKKNDCLVVQKQHGYKIELIENWMKIPLSTVTPLTTCVRKRYIYWLGSRQEILRESPHIIETEDDNHPVTESIITLPLIVGAEVLGALAFRFDRPQKLNLEEEEYLMAIGRQCAQALHRAQLYEAANEAIQVRDEFLSIASHELKTPLSPLKLQLQILSRKIRNDTFKEMEPDQLIKAFEDADEQVNKLTSLIDDLLDVTRITSGKMTFSPQEVNLTELVKEVAENYKHKLTEANCDLDLELNEKLIVKVDRMRMEQVLINLLINAAKYAPGKPVHITLSEQANRAILTVRDEGQGISLSDQRRIFERFERVRGRNNIGGLGLGLFISHQIVAAHGGKLWVDSKPGQGAIFKVELPV